MEVQEVEPAGGEVEVEVSRRGAWRTAHGGGNKVVGGGGLSGSGGGSGGEGESEVRARG